MGAAVDTREPVAASAPARPDGDLLGLLGVVVCGLLPIVLFNNLYWGTWAPKAALCLLLLLPGLVAVARLVVARSPAAIAGAAFLAVAALSTAVSDRPALSLAGPPNWGTGWLLLAACVAAWAVGVVMGDRRRRQLALVLLAGVVVNAAVAFAQVRVNAERTRGLMGNAVFLGGLVAGGLYMLARRAGRERGSWWWLPAVALAAGAAQISGGRAAVALAVVAVAASLRGAGVARTAAIVAAVAVGVAVAPIGARQTVLGSTRSSPSAMASAGGDTRFAVWRVSGGAIAERPLLGWGPGRFAAATGRRYTPTAAREYVVLQDAHNWVVGTAVTTGLLGTALLLAWLALAARGARGPLAGFAAIVALSSLVQPLHVALTPLATMALGAAGSGAVRRRARPLPDRPLGGAWGAAAGAGTAIGLVLAAALVVGQLALQRGVAGDSLADLRTARALSPPWPEILLRQASAETTYGLAGSEAHKARALALTRRATELDPTDPTLWAELGYLEEEWGTVRASAAAFRRGLEAEPWDVVNLRGSADLARRTGDGRLLAEDCRRLRIMKVDFPACAPGH